MHCVNGSCACNGLCMCNGLCVCNGLYPLLHREYLSVCGNRGKISVGGKRGNNVLNTHKDTILYTHTVCHKQRTQFTVGKWVCSVCVTEHNALCEWIVYCNGLCPLLQGGEDP